VNEGTNTGNLDDCSTVVHVFMGLCNHSHKIQLKLSACMHGACSQSPLLYI